MIYYITLFIKTSYFNIFIISKNSAFGEIWKKRIISCEKTTSFQNNLLTLALIDNHPRC